jgi:hypothetical protein
MLLQVAVEDIGQLTDFALRAVDRRQARLPRPKLTRRIRAISMQTRMAWAARMWPLYLLAGLGWGTPGGVLGVPRGLGLISTGLVCLAFGVQPLLARSSRGG